MTVRYNDDVINLINFRRNCDDSVFGILTWYSKTLIWYLEHLISIVTNAIPALTQSNPAFRELGYCVKSFRCALISFIGFDLVSSTDPSW